MNRPQIQEFPDWAKKYIDLVGDDIVAVLEAQGKSFSDFINELEHISDYAYAPGKWTIREMVGHIIDTERILVYRLLCIARGEKASLPGFEEDDYVKFAHFADRSLTSLSEEFLILRKANMFLIKSLNDRELDTMGNANQKQISVRAITWVLAGHVIHHTNIINERYL